MVFGIFVREGRIFHLCKFEKFHQEIGQKYYFEKGKPNLGLN